MVVKRVNGKSRNFSTNGHRENLITKQQFQANVWWFCDKINIYLLGPVADTPGSSLSIVVDSPQDEQLLESF